MNVNKILFYGMKQIQRGSVKKGEHRDGQDDENCGDRRVLNLGDEHQTITATGHYHALSCVF